MKNQHLSTRLLDWYSTVKRDLPWRKTGNPYAIWVSEVMLQQTQVKTVIPYYERFLDRFPSVEHLGESNLDDVLAIWSGLGYYSRARRLWEGARYLIQNLGGIIPKDYEALVKIPGIGDYTAGAVASIAFGQRVAAIDGNVKRVVSRLLAWPEPIETTRSLRYFRESLMTWQSDQNPGDFNQALMELGAMVCKPTRPHCEACPLAQFCEGYLQGDVQHYPVKKPKSQRQEVTRLTFVLRKENQIYLQKRPSKGLLADLWELPGVELSQDDLQNFTNSLSTISIDTYLSLFRQAIPESEYERQVEEDFKHGIEFHGPVWYTFSHRRWELIWLIIDLDKKYRVGCDLGETEPTRSSLLREIQGTYQLEALKVRKSNMGKWVSSEDLRIIPLPVAFQSIIEKLVNF
ncbi:adenine glycosylase [Desulfosporosinus sp. HMP52]|nr:adenine glycosylase [Desulfosporosinus sp. HMP52]